MRRKIQYQSIPETLADELESRIRQRKWQKQLPGYREIAREYTVSKKSASEAFTLLEQRGVIHPAEPGKRRAIRICARGLNPEAAPMLVISGERSRIGSQDSELVNSHVHDWLRREGQIRYARADMTRSKSCERAVGRWIEDYKPGSFLVTLGTRPLLKAIAETGLPTYCIGGEVGRVKDRVCGCGYELKGALDQVLRELRRRGHTRVLFPIRQGWEVIAKDVLEKQREHFGDLHSEDELQRFCVKFHENTPDAWFDGWRHHLTTLQPTAVICEKEADLLSLYGFCHSNGWRIPQDISVVSLVNSWTTDWIWPRPTLLRFPYQKAERLFLRWVRSGLTLRGFRTLAMEWQEGQTLLDLG